jgi:hypothetical protein
MTGSSNPPMKRSSATPSRCTSSGVSPPPFFIRRRGASIAKEPGNSSATTREMLQWIHVNVFGWWTTDPARLELALDEFSRPVDELVSSGAIFRVSLEDRFQRVRAGFQAFDIKILALHQPEFLIGGVPALAMREGHGGLGIFVVMPLTPHHVAVLGQGDQSRQATADEVDRYNTLQVRLAYRYVYFQPTANSKISL